MKEIADKYYKAYEFVELFNSLTEEEKSLFYEAHPDLYETLGTLSDFIALCDDLNLTQYILEVN